MYLYHIFFIHFSVDGHLGCFHVLVTVNSAAMNIRVRASFQILVFSGYMPMSGMVGPYDSSIFSFLKNIHIVHHSRYAMLSCLVIQLCPTLCSPMDCSTPGPSVHGILQARILEWTAMPSSRDLPNPGTEPGSPTLQVDSLPAELSGKAVTIHNPTNSVGRFPFPHTLQHLLFVGF